MNKYLIVALCIFILIILVIVFIKPKNIHILSKDFELTYKMSAGIPFKRVIEIEDESIVKLVKSYVSKDENTGGKVGAPVYMTYTFEGLKEGVTTIIYKVVSIVEDSDVMTEERTVVQVDKDKKISIVKETNNN